MLQVAASEARSQPNMMFAGAPDPSAVAVPAAPADPDAGLIWQANRLQRQVTALQEEREALAQHLDRMQEALLAAKKKGKQISPCPSCLTPEEAQAKSSYATSFFCNGQFPTAQCWCYNHTIALWIILYRVGSLRLVARSVACST